MQKLFGSKQLHRVREAEPGNSRELCEKMDTARSGLDPLYLFACRLEWLHRGSMAAYLQLIAALDDSNPEIRAVAEDLLHRTSPRPQRPSSKVRNKIA
jgi:hypothetical protein